MDIQEELFRRQGGRERVLAFADTNFSPFKNSEGKFGYKKNEEIVLMPRFDDASYFGDGIAPVKYGDKWGYINKIGDFVIPCIYDCAYSFHGGLALVKQNGMCFLIDKNNSCAVILNSTYNYVSAFSEGFAIVCDENGLYGFIDERGSEVIKPQYRSVLGHAVGPFVSGLARVCINKKWGYINYSGNLVIKAQFEEASEFDTNGFATVTEIESFSLDRVTYEIDKNGKKKEKYRFEGKTQEYIETGFEVLKWIGRILTRFR